MGGRTRSGGWPARRIRFDRPGLRRAATTAAVALTLLLATAAACAEQRAAPPPSVQQRLEQSSIWGQPVLRIGVATNEPLMGEVRNGVHTGFDVEIARYLAASLGYASDKDIRFVEVHTDDRLEFLIGGKVDLVVASLSYTEERAKLIGFAGPYLVTRQSFLIPVAAESRLRTLEDFQAPGVDVCSSGSSTTESELARRGFAVKLVEDLQECVDGMLSGRFDAMSSDKTILAGFRSQHPQKLMPVDLPLGAIERICVGVPIGDTALRDVVGHFLKESYEQGRDGGTSPWLTAYNKTLGPWYEDGTEVTQPEPQDVPELVDFDDKASPR
ncbi:transporter substrate-binding domain-containing protein [Catenuloplanes atrovinosus]|uniref:Glutamate transport system substrate-binding protein n=1 Tax=Catenuloplanes atrovinosus TaxID=137266 RepID=A0AAE4CAR4_9ACTN|nr:transporter substrate-binding domain-containing protein [Catenuloplanes atrovinosus]MDR7276089.1 glutamate transport system substrate-binding protein [Catenuloplanes atrovinosus]